MTHPTEPGFASLDRSIRAAEARLTQGVSPMAVLGPWADWAFHLSRAPGKQMELALRAQQLAASYALWLARSAVEPAAAPPVEPTPRDPRFADPGWQVPPFRALMAAALLAEDWWLATVRDVPGVTPRHMQQMEFLMRQALGAAAPEVTPSQPW